MKDAEAMAVVAISRACGRRVSGWRKPDGPRRKTLSRQGKADRTPTEIAPRVMGR